jgi:hypothetical protein
VAAGIVVIVFAIKGFFTDNAKTNIQLLHDAFFSTGALMMLFSGMLFIADEGGFLAITYILGRAIKTFIPFGRLQDETYAQYRERKTGKKEKNSPTGSVFFTGLFFFLISLLFLAIWYSM